MSHQFDKKDSNFRAFLPFLSIMVGAMLFIGLGVSMGQQREKASENIQPDVRRSFSDCKILDNQTIRIRTVTRHYASTSCGYFSVPQNMVSKMEEGLTYDLAVTYPKGDHKGYGYIRESIPTVS